MGVAALWGTVSGYAEYYDKIVIEKPDGRVAVISQQTFDDLYFRLDEFNAALKEDCIEYIVFDYGEPTLEEYRFLADAMTHGFIFLSSGVYMFYQDSGEIAMSPGSIILKNFRGELMYMEKQTFDKYYDAPGGEFYEPF